MDCNGVAEVTKRMIFGPFNTTVSERNAARHHVAECESCQNYLLDMAERAINKLGHVPVDSMKEALTQARAEMATKDPEATYEGGL